MEHRYGEDVRWFLCLLVVVIPSVTSIDPTFLSIPGDVDVLVFKPLTLQWTHSVNESELSDCYWEYEDPDVNNAPKRIFSYSSLVGLTPGELPDWSVIDPDNPCTSGITKESARKTDAGLYKMTVGSLASPNSTVHIYYAGDMHYNIFSANTILSGSAAFASHDVNAAKAIKNKYYSATVELNDKFPPLTNISIEKRGPGGVLDLSVLCNQSRRCDVNYTLGVESDVTVLIQIFTGLRDYPIIHVLQTFDGANLADVNLTAVIVGVVLGGLCVVLFILMLRYRRKADKY